MSSSDIHLLRWNLQINFSAIGRQEDLYMTEWRGEGAPGEGRADTGGRADPGDHGRGPGCADRIGRADPRSRDRPGEDQPAARRRGADPCSGDLPAHDLLSDSIR